jgi:hypothetical protein
LASRALELKLGWLLPKLSIEPVVQIDNSSLILVFDENHLCSTEKRQNLKLRRFSDAAVYHLKTSV